jgi:hypothetical protein
LPLICQVLLLKTRRLLNNFFSGAQRICDFLLFTRFGISARRFYFLLSRPWRLVHFPITYTALAANVFWCTSQQLQDVKAAAEIFSG